MRSALLRYSYDDVMKPLAVIVMRKGFYVREIDKKTGRLKAHKSRLLFGKKIDLDMEVVRIDDETTKVIVQAKKKNGITEEITEELLVGSIYKYF